MRAGELLLRHPDAMRFIGECRWRRIVILGMDFLEEQGGRMVPLLASGDFSDMASDPVAAARTTQRARMLLDEGLPDGADWVTFVLRAEDANSVS